MRTRKAHLVQKRNDGYFADSICGRFSIAIPFPYDSHKGKEMCKICEKINARDRLGWHSITYMPTSWLSLQTGGWTYSNGMAR